MPRNHLASSTAACCWIPLFALRCEEARRPELASQPCALLAPDASRRIWQVSPLARRAGAKPGMTVSQAIGLCPALRLCEPDPVHYDEQFARLLAALSEVSPVVEPAELGRAYVGTDGVEGPGGGGGAGGSWAARRPSRSSPRSRFSLPSPIGRCSHMRWTGWSSARSKIRGASAGGCRWCASVPSSSTGRRGWSKRPSR